MLFPTHRTGSSLTTIILLIACTATTWATPEPADRSVRVPAANETFALAKRDYLTTTSKIVPSDDLTPIYVEASGDSSGSPIVLVHGLSLTSGVWDNMVSDSQLSSLFYLVRFDMRGHGRSGMPTTAGGYTSAQYAQDFSAVLNAFNVKKPLFVGWGLGAAMLADICSHLNCQSLLLGAVYLDGLPYTGAEGAVYKAGILAVVPDLISTTDVASNKAAVIAFANALWNTPSNIPFAIRSSWMGMTVLQPPAVTDFVFTRAQDPTELQNAGKAGLPLLVLYGTNDQHINGSAVVGLVQPYFKKLSVTNVPGGSHAMFYEEASVVRAVSGDHLLWYV